MMNQAYVFPAVAGGWGAEVLLSDSPDSPTYHALNARTYRGAMRECERLFGVVTDGWDTVQCLRECEPTFAEVIGW